MHGEDKGSQERPAVDSDPAVRAHPDDEMGSMIN